MTRPNLINTLSAEQISQMSEQDLSEALESKAQNWKNKPHTLYYLTVNGAKTKKKSLVKSSSDIGKIDGLSIARVGDDVIYADGTSSKIITGAGITCVIDGTSIVLADIRLENGDEIIECQNTSVTIRLFKDQPIPKNFLGHD